MVYSALITGHTKGVGKEITTLLLQQGIAVVGVARTSLPATSGLTQYQADLSTAEGITKECDYLKGHQFNAIILNAGANSIKPPEAYLPEEIIGLMQVNLVAHACLIRGTISGLLQNQGHVIGIASISGTEVARWNNYYGAAKAGLHHLLNNLFDIKLQLFLLK